MKYQMILQVNGCKTKNHTERSRGKKQKKLGLFSYPKFPVIRINTEIIGKTSILFTYEKLIVEKADYLTSYFQDIILIFFRSFGC